MNVKEVPGQMAESVHPELVRAMREIAISLVDMGHVLARLNAIIPPGDSQVSVVAETLLEMGWAIERWGVKATLLPDERARIAVQTWVTDGHTVEVRGAD